MSPLSVAEVGDLYELVLVRLHDALLPAITMANRTGELADLLRLLGLSDLVGDGGALDMRPKRILVIGATQINADKLRSIAKKNGFDAKLIDFELDYNGLKHYNFAALRHSPKYRAVLVGPGPHSTPGTNGASSFVVEMETHPETYPPVIRMQDSNELKVTNNSFRVALEELAIFAA